MRGRWETRLWVGELEAMVGLVCRRLRSEAILLLGKLMGVPPILYQNQIVGDKPRQGLENKTSEDGHLLENGKRTWTGVL